MTSVFTVGALLITGMVSQRCLIWKIHPQPKPTVPRLLGDATNVTFAMKCKDWGTEFLLGELTHSYVHLTGFVTHMSHYFKFQLMFAQPLTEKGMPCFLKLAKKVLLII